VPRSDRLADLVDAYLEAETENSQRSALERVLTRAGASLGAWSQEIIPHLASRLQEALDREPDGSRPNLEADALGRILFSWNGLSMSAALSGFPPEAEVVIRELLSILRRNQQRLGRLHKGTPLHQLGWLRLRTDPAGATPYILAALVEDVIRDPEGFMGAPAAQVCVNVLGIDPSLFNEVKTFVTAPVPGPDEVQELARSDPELLSLVRSMNDPPNNELLRISLHYDPAIGDLLRATIG
jgi:hypothetical protein